MRVNLNDHRGHIRESHLFTATVVHALVVFSLETTHCFLLMNINVSPDSS